MKSLIRWSATLTLIGGVVCSSVLAGAARVLALPAAQVMERLRSVPVFTLANEQGAPLVATPEEGTNRQPVAGVFINHEDAEAFLNNLKTNNPQAAQGVRVVPVSLADVYQLAQSQEPRQGAQAAQGAEDQLRFAFIPAQQQVDAAMTLLRQNGQTVERFQGVPLFVARSGGENAGYLTIRQGDKQVIPVFFDKAELQGVIDRLRQQQPDLATNVNVQVVGLEGLIQTLQTSDNPELNQLLLVPARSSVDFVRSLQPAGQGQGQGQGGQQRPQAQPQQR
ncbi:MAG TPA: Tic22 family protein [Trichocoleus sp.]|jgi:nickel transport protein